MRMEDLRNFLVVAEVRNLRLGAEKLGLSQSALSKMLSRLENEAGLRLFERTPRGVELTEAGETLRIYASKLNTVTDDLERALGEQRLARSGTLRLGTLPALVPILLSVVSEFMGHRPLATVKFEAHLSSHLIDMLRAGKADLIVAAMPPVIPQDLETVLLGPLFMHIIARGGHPRLDRFRRLADIKDERWVLPSDAHYLRGWLEQRFAEARLPPPQVAVESYTLLAPLADLVRQSDLLGILPSYAFSGPVANGVVAIDLEDLRWQHQLALCWRRDAVLTPLCSDFRDTLLAHCREIGL